jgi:hypothetical protein
MTIMIAGSLSSSIQNKSSYCKEEKRYFISLKQMNKFITLDRHNKVRYYVGLDMYREWNEINSHKKVLYMNLETTKPRGRPRNRWQDEVREDGKIVGGYG